MWPDFHAGAALAVSQIWAADQQPISGLEFNFARPNEMTARAAGYLLGLGVTGHLRSMVVYQAFSYLDPKNELVSAGVLIGLSAAFTGTADARVTSLLSVHLAALLPQKSTELNISLVVQSSALLGLGLLYMATGKKTMAELMAKELTGIRIKHHEEAEHCREAYALGAGFAFGMIMLQKGRMSAKHAFDDNLVKQLHSCIDIHGQHPLPGMHKAAVAGIDVAITSSAATVALALMFFDSSRKDIAQLLPLPQAIAQLDYIRPDLIMLRTIARSIICLSSIKPDPSWVQSIMPKFLAESLAREKAGLTDMSTDLFRAYWSVVCGACYAIGLKYAGTAHADAHTTLLAYYDHLAKAIKGHCRSLFHCILHSIKAKCENSFESYEKIHSITRHVHHRLVISDDLCRHWGFRNFSKAAPCARPNGRLCSLQHPFRNLTIHRPSFHGQRQVHAWHFSSKHSNQFLLILSRFSHRACGQSLASASS